MVKAIAATAISVMFLCVTNLNAAPVGGTDAFGKSANAAVDRIAREDGFSGVILVADDNHVLMSREEGLADRENKIRITLETKFPLESLTKQFTAAAVLLLVEDRKLALSDVISKYENVPSAWKDITIAQLLTHASGIQDTPGDFHSYKDFVDDATKTPLAFVPGKGFLYSNAGYGLLTEVIETVSGQDYGDFLQRRIFAPLGMRNTGYGVIPGETISGYVREASAKDGTGWRKGEPAQIQIHGGFGGLYSTVGDMLIWSRALNSDALLTAASRKAMFADYGYNYGFGWRFASKFGRKLVWHTGSDPAAGFASIFDYFPDERLTVIALTNSTAPTNSTATLVIDGKSSTFPANAVRKAVEQVESLYFTGTS